MKTIVLCFALLIPSLLSAAPVSNSANKASALSTQDNAQEKPVEVVEVYSIYCGGCFYWEQSLIPELKKTFKEHNITFRQAHMAFMGKFAKEASTALAITEGTPLYDPVKAALFKRIHVDRKGDWPSGAEFFKTLEQAGLSKKEYDQNKMSPVVTKTLADWGTYAKSVKAVPTFLLNGKYPINTKGIKTAKDFMERLDSTIQTETKTHTQ